MSKKESESPNPASCKPGILVEVLSPKKYKLMLSVIFSFLTSDSFMSLEPLPAFNLHKFLLFLSRHIC